MATFEQVQEFDTSTLDSLEREFVRQLLGITGKAGTATYIESESRMSGLTGSQNQIVRGLLQDYNDIAFDTTSVLGGDKGVNFNPQRDKSLIANELRRMLYPSEQHEVGFIEVVPANAPMGSINMIPVTYEVGSQDEFS
jgi:hypothetical protein